MYHNETFKIIDTVKLRLFKVPVGQHHKNKVVSLQKSGDEKMLAAITGHASRAGSTQVNRLHLLTLKEKEDDVWKFEYLKVINMQE